MNLDKLKRKIHLIAFDQLPFVMKLLRIPPPQENADGHDHDPELEVIVDTNDEDHSEEFHEIEDGDALAFENEIEIDENLVDPELVKNEENLGAKLALKDQIKHKVSDLKNKINVDRVKNFKQEWAGYSEEQKKEKKKKFFSIGVRALAIIVVLWVVLDDVIFQDEKPSNPQTADNARVETEPNNLAENPTNEFKEVNKTDSTDSDEMVDNKLDTPQDDLSGEMNEQREEVTVDNTEKDETDEIDDIEADAPEPGMPQDDSTIANNEVKEQTDDPMSDDIFTEDMNAPGTDSEMTRVDSTSNDSTNATENSDELTDMVKDDGGTEGDLETTDFDKKGYEKVSGENKINEVIFDEAGYKDITSEELATEVESSMTELEKDQSPQDREIEGVSINVLRELEEKLKQKELERDQELLGKKEDLSLQGKKAPVVDFYRAGRALVYNCQASHWACVDELSFLKCRDAHIVNTQKKAYSTCQPYDVYISEKDCQRAQYDYMDDEKGEASCLK